MRKNANKIRHASLSLVKYGLPAAVLLIIIDMFAPLPFGLPQETHEWVFVIRFVMYTLTFGILFALAAKPNKPND